MKIVVCVREHAWLTTEPVATSLECAQVTQSAFEYLCRLSERFTSAGARLAQVDGQRRLKLDNHVGVLQTPCGTTVEILPKHQAAGGSPADGRALLRKMMQRSLDLPKREVGHAPLALLQAPLSEWVMRRFLEELDILVKRGLRFEYLRVPDDLSYLRGRLDLAAQIRRPPGTAHRFHVQHDVFQPDRAENRLLKLALERVRSATAVAENWQLAQELSLRMAEIRPSEDQKNDFKIWGNDRLLAHYGGVRPWCELVLGSQMPLATMGEYTGISMLFPMERLFERYFSDWLKRRVTSSVDVRTQARGESLCQHDGRPIFQLKPDMLVSSHGTRWVLDTKWKLLDASDRSNKYGISESDAYQLYAYGQRYLGGVGVMGLIYPRHAGFNAPLAPFHFSETLVMQVLPFDLDRDVLVGESLLGLPIRSTTGILPLKILRAA